MCTSVAALMMGVPVKHHLQTRGPLNSQGLSACICDARALCMDKKDARCFKKSRRSHAKDRGKINSQAMNSGPRLAGAI
jgi:hypothetical protein